MERVGRLCPVLGEEVGGWVEEKKAVRMSYCTASVGGWVSREEAT